MPIDVAFDQRGLSRRVLLATISMALVGIACPHLAMAALTPTPRQTAGPFYPKSLPLHSDNDLVRIAGHEKQADGIVTHISGRVVDSDGRPVPQARIEIWQCDSHGRYHNVDDRSSRSLDPNFQGYGTTSSGDDGGYRFRTIRPVAYPPNDSYACARIPPISLGSWRTSEAYGSPLDAPRATKALLIANVIVHPCGKSPPPSRRTVGSTDANN
jgi:hypothetical protein